MYFTSSKLLCDISGLFYGSYSALFCLFYLNKSRDMCSPYEYLTTFISKHVVCTAISITCLCFKNFAIVLFFIVPHFYRNLLQTLTSDAMIIQPFLILSQEIWMNRIKNTCGKIFLIVYHMTCIKPITHSFKSIGIR